MITRATTVPADTASATTASATSATARLRRLAPVRLRQPRLRQASDRHGVGPGRRSPGPLDCPHALASLPPAGALAVVAPGLRRRGCAAPPTLRAVHLGADRAGGGGGRPRLRPHSGPLRI